MNKDSVMVTSCEELSHLKRPWFWEGLGAGGEGDDRGWDGWMASLTRWAWVWVNFGSLWWRPGVLRFTGSQRAGHDWATELNWTELNATESVHMNALYSPSERWLWFYFQITIHYRKNSQMYSVCDNAENQGSRVLVLSCLSESMGLRW